MCEIVPDSRKRDGLLLAVTAPIAAVSHGPERRQLDNRIHRFEQAPIMAGDNRPTAPGRKKIDHGRAPLPIEIVGGLVEQQEVRLRENQRGETNPRDLPARQAPELDLRSDAEPDKRKGRCKPCLKGPSDLGDLLGRGFPAFSATKQLQRWSRTEQVDHLRARKELDVLA
ncbi:hypothetical protein ACVWZZ_002569 [Bradyrhizobium sp. LM6.10]